MTKAKAKKYSLIKWVYAKETGCNYQELLNHLEENRPRIYELPNACGFCGRAIKLKIPCGKCELDKLCDTTYQYWEVAKTKKTRIKYATQIYNDIKGS